MKQIVIINGYGGVGKDVFCEFCSQEVQTFNYSSVKEIKELATQIGWDGGKTEKDRKFLSDLKLLTSDYNDYPYHCIVNMINKFMEDPYELMFIHIRDIPEIERLVAEYPHIHTLLVRNSRVKHITTNIADANVEDYGYEYIIENNGSFEDLKDAAHIFITDIFGYN